MAFIGNTPTQQAFTPAVDFFNGDGSTVAFTLSKPVASVAQVQAVISNVPQNPGSAYTVSGNTITFTSAPPSGTQNIYVYYTSPITQVIAPGQGTVTTTSLMDSSVTTAKIADGAVTPAKLSTGAPTWDTSSNLIATGRIQKSGTTTVISLNTGEAYGSSATLGIITTDSGADAINIRLYNGSYYYPFQFNKYGVMSVGGATASTSGAGITFPATQSASTDANTLDDYEEGTWTPVDTSGAGLTFGAQTSARFTKIGRCVFIDCEVSYPSNSSVVSASIGGLPFTSKAVLDYNSGTCMNDANLNIWSFVTTNTTSISLYKQAASFTGVTNAELTTRTLYISVWYLTTY